MNFETVHLQKHYATFISEMQAYYFRTVFWVMQKYQLTQR